MGTGFKYVNKNSLKEIHADGSSIGQAGFGPIGGSESLEVLWLNSARVTDKAMQGIGKCANLRHLRIEKNDLTDKGTSYLKGHRKLERVFMKANTLLTNKTLGHLTQTKTLQLVNVANTWCSQKVLPEFWKYLPDCEVVLK